MSHDGAWGAGQTVVTGRSAPWEGRTERAGCGARAFHGRERNHARLRPDESTPSIGRDADAKVNARLHVYAGPSFGLKSNCRLEATSGDVSGSIDCDNDFDLKSFDLGGVVGAGIGFPLGGVGTTVGARYQHGFTDIATDATVKNHVISLYASIEFGKR